jgi:hypothetical protein
MNKTILFFLTALLLGCKNNPVAPTPLPDNRPLITTQEYGNLNLNSIDYDVVRITHKAGIILRIPNIIRIGIGTKDDGGFTSLVTSSATYDTTVRDYIFNFDFTIRMDSSKITAPITVRYYTSDFTYSDVDTTVALYQYPYLSAKVFLDTSNIDKDLFHSVIEGISLYGSTFFFHPLNDGLYTYDLTTHHCNLRWNGYIIGLHIAADSNFVFCDVNHNQIVRYNLTTNTADSTFPALNDVDIISGMAINNHILYVLVFGRSYPNPEYLKMFTLDGVLLDSISYPSTKVLFMAVYDSIVYCKDESYNISPISRFNLRTKSFLPEVASPAKEVEPITIYNGQLYYSNLYKNFIGVMPIADLVKSIVTIQDENKIQHHNSIMSHFSKR